MNGLDLLVGALAAYRLTQLVVFDGISENAVAWLRLRSDFLDGLLSCAHCTGVWAAALVVILLELRQHWCPLGMVLWALAIAGAISIVEHATHWLVEVNDG